MSDTAVQERVETLRHNLELWNYQYHVLDQPTERMLDRGTRTVAGFRDHFDTSRKHALALLEHLDQRRLTRRQGDSRVRF